MGALAEAWKVPPSSASGVGVQVEALVGSSVAPVLMERGPVFEALSSDVEALAAVPGDEQVAAISQLQEPKLLVVAAVAGILGDLGAVVEAGSGDVEALSAVFRNDGVVLRGDLDNSCGQDTAGLRSGRCIDVKGAPAITNGSSIHLWDCELSGLGPNGSATDQRWRWGG